MFGGVSSGQGPSLWHKQVEASKKDNSISRLLCLSMKQFGNRRENKAASAVRFHLDSVLAKPERDEWVIPGLCFVTSVHALCPRLSLWEAMALLGFGHWQLSPEHCHLKAATVKLSHPQAPDSSPVLLSFPPPKSVPFGCPGLGWSPGLEDCSPQVWPSDVHVATTAGCPALVACLQRTISPTRGNRD